MTERDTRVTSLRDLPQAIEPKADLWPQIEAQIAGRASAAAAPAAAETRRRITAAPRAYLAAAAMVACVAVGVWIGRSALPGPAPLASAVRPAAAALPVTWVPDPRYQRQHQELLRALGAQLAALPPASRAKVMASLEAIGKAKQELESALGKDPGNALLQELLVNTYQDEMRVLTDVHEASNAGEGI